MLHRTGEANSATAILLPLLAGLLAARLCSTSSRAIHLLIILAALQAIYALYYIKMGISLYGAPGFIRPSGTFDNPDVFIGVLLVTLPAAIAETVLSSKTFDRTAWGLCTAVSLAALVSTGSRVGLLAVFCALIFITLRVASRWKIQIVSVLAVAAFAVCFTHWRAPSQISLSFQTAKVRTAVWKQSLEGASLRVWSGAGIGAFDQIKLPSKHVTACLLPLPPLKEPGDALLHWIEELGIAGGILYGFFVVAIVKALRRQEWNVGTVMGSAWIALLVSCLFETPFGSLLTFR